MTTTIEGAELTQIGPGTAMGQLMRQYWLPALKSSELERDGDPLRLMLLGEKLIAFRDSAGRVGVMDQRCPHRCASLFLGRNEQGGLRCIYHGWKYDVLGNCIDMPSVPEQQDFKHKVKAKAYRTVERAGLVWVYMGEGADAPPLPGFEVLDLPPDDHNSMCDSIWRKKARTAQTLPQTASKEGTPIGGTVRGGVKMLPSTTDWLGGWRIAMNDGKDWGMDRDKQRGNAIYSVNDG